MPRRRRTDGESAWRRTWTEKCEFRMFIQDMKRFPVEIRDYIYHRLRKHIKTINVRVCYAESSKGKEEGS